MVSKVLINRLFEYGLGELYIRHATAAGAIIGQLVQEKGRLILKDRGILSGLTAAQVVHAPDSCVWSPTPSVSDSSIIAGASTKAIS